MRDGERSDSIEVPGSGYSAGSERYPNILLTNIPSWHKLVGVACPSLTAQRVLSNEGIILFHVSIPPSCLGCERLRGRDHSPHSASAPSARNSAWPLQLLQTDVRLTRRLNQIFCPWKVSIYSVHDVTGPL